MEPVKEAQVCTEQMAIMERYERVIAYLYPIVQSVPRKRCGLVTRDGQIHITL